MHLVDYDEDGEALTLADVLEDQECIAAEVIDEDVCFKKPEGLTQALLRQFRLDYWKCDRGDGEL